MRSNNVTQLTDTLYEQLNDITVGVVGLGGIGSIVCQTLAHIGVRSFILVDDDNIDKTNLIKNVGSSPSDIGKKKYQVVKKLIDKITDHKSSIQIIDEKMTINNGDKLGRKLKNTNFIFACANKQNGREAINTFCVSNKKPFIDCGVGMDEQSGLVNDIVGQIIIVLPDYHCLQCHNKTDRLQYGHDKIPYIHINSIIANLAVMEFVKFISSFHQNAHMIYYNALTQTTKKLNDNKKSKRCGLCKQVYNL